jgi:hypothetical protein
VIPTSDLGQVADDLQSIRVALGQVILQPGIDGTMTVENVDNGSLAMLLTVGVPAVSAIAGLVWAAAVIYKKIQEGRLVERYVQGLDEHNSMLHQLRESQGVLLRRLVEAEARHLDREIFGEEEDPERLARIKFSIEKFADLIERGTQVHPALVAPESVKNLFPDFQKLSGVESRIKQITEKASSPEAKA